MKQPYKRPAVTRGFRLVDTRLRSKPITATRATVLALTGMTPRRIIENTPTLKALYELLERPLP